MLKPAQTYDEIVKELIADEKQYLRDLHMITKVFRDVVMKQDAISSSELDAIFSNINEVRLSNLPYLRKSSVR